MKHNIKIGKIKYLYYSKDVKEFIKDENILQQYITRDKYKFHWQPNNYNGSDWFTNNLFDKN